MLEPFADCASVLVCVMRFASHFDTEEEEHQCTSYCLRGDHKERIAKRFLISSKELEIL